MATNSIGGPKDQVPTQPPALLDEQKPAQGKISAEKVAAGANTKATPKMAGTVTQDTLGKLATPTAPAAPVVAPQEAIAQLNTPQALLAQMTAFSAMSAELKAPPAGATVAERFAGEFSFSDSAPTTTFVPGSLFAALNPNALTSKERVVRANAALRMLTKHEPALAAAKLAALTPEQQAALKQMGEVMRPLYAHQVTSALRKGAMSPTERKALLAQRQNLDGTAVAFGFSRAVVGVSARDTNQGDEDAQQANADGLHAMKSYLHSGQLGAITIPGPQVTSLESSTSRILRAGFTTDIDGLVQMVMMDAAKLEDEELMELIGEMQKKHLEKERMRVLTERANKQAADMKVALRKRYDERCAIPQTNPPNKRRIDPKVTSFEDFCNSQQLKMTNGNLTDPLDDLLNENATSDGANFGLSPNERYYPQGDVERTDGEGNPISQGDIDMAGKLGIEPQQYADLRRTFEDSPEIADKFMGDIVRFLTASAREGGVGLRSPAPAGVDQATMVTNWLQTNDPEIVARKLERDFGLDDTHLNILKIYYAEGLTPAERAAAGSFDQWVRSSGTVPGFASSNSGTENKAAIDAWRTRTQAVTDSQAFAASYGIEETDVEFLRGRFDSSGASGTFENWLERNEDGPKLVKNQPNADRLSGWVTELRSSGHGGGMFPKTFTLHDSAGTPFQREFNSFHEMLSWVGSNAGTYGSDVNQQMSNFINQAMGPYAAELEDLLVDFIYGEVRKHNGDFQTDDFWETAKTNLKAFVDNLPPELQGPANQCIALRMAEAADECRVGVPDNGYVFGQRWVRWGNDGMGHRGSLKPDGIEGDRCVDMAELRAIAGGLNADKAQYTTNGLAYHEPSEAQLDEQWDALVAYQAQKDVENLPNPPVLPESLQYIAELPDAPYGEDAYRTMNPAPLTDEELRYLADFLKRSDAQTAAGGIDMRGRELAARWYRDGHPEWKAAMEAKSTARTNHDVDVDVAWYTELESRLPLPRSADISTLPPLTDAEIAQVDEWNTQLMVLAGRDGEYYTDAQFAEAGIDKELFCSMRHREMAGFIKEREHDRVVVYVAMRPTYTVATTVNETPGADPRTESMNNLTTPVDHSIAAEGHVGGFQEVTLGQLQVWIDSLKNKKDSLGELTEQLSLRLQLHQDRRSKLYQTLSNIMKKVADVQSGIVGNLK